MADLTRWAGAIRADGVVREPWAGARQTPVPDPGLPTVAQVLGRPARTLREWAGENVAIFR